MRFLKCRLGILLIAIILGCHSPRQTSGEELLPPIPPKTAESCNAIWTESDLYQGNAVLIVRCRGVEEYGKTSAGKNWNYHWSLISMDVLTVERGTWTKKEVNFVYPDAWPTPESGIMIDKNVFPFAKGYIFALTMETSTKPATVVAFERRSFVPPYGPLKYIVLVPGTIDPQSERGRIDQAIANFENEHNISAKNAKTDTPEDFGDTWIVHKRDGEGINARSWLYRVQKSTYAVQAIPY